LPLGMAAGSGPWWTAADLSVSSLQITAVTAAAAHRVAASDSAVAAHPWLERATDYCLTAIQGIDEPPFAYVLLFSVRLLDALQDSRPEQAESGLARLKEFVPGDGELPVQGGTENEALHPLDPAPYPDRPARPGRIARLAGPCHRTRGRHPAPQRPKRRSSFELTGASSSLHRGLDEPVRLCRCVEDLAAILDAEAGDIERQMVAVG
jgi:hypothetical protein